MEGKEYFLALKLNGHDVRLKLDSGCDKPIINQTLWREIGEPDLMDIDDIRRTLTGVIPLKGGFTAKVSVAGIEFECPFQVSDDDTTRNLFGRRALAFLVDLDWNRFISDGTVAVVSDFPPHVKKRPTDSALEWKTLPFYTDVVVNGKEFRMVLDTGAMDSIAGLYKWKELGKPPINPVNILVHSTSDEPIPILGECVLKINYNGTEAQLPLLIAESYVLPAIMGTNWFDSLQPNFNSIFRGIQFDEPLEQAAAVPNRLDGHMGADPDAPPSQSHFGKD